MVVVESFGWIASFTKRAKGKVYKKIKRERGQKVARECLGALLKTQMIPVNAEIAVLAAEVSLEHSLAMADSLVLATARAFGAELLTSDFDFKGIEGVRVF